MATHYATLRLIINLAEDPAHADALVTLMELHAAEIDGSHLRHLGALIADVNLLDRIVPTVPRRRRRYLIAPTIPVEVLDYWIGQPKLLAGEWESLAKCENLERRHVLAVLAKGNRPAVDVLLERHWGQLTTDEILAKKHKYVPAIEPRGDYRELVAGLIDHYGGFPLTGRLEVLYAYAVLAGVPVAPEHLQHVKTFMLAGDVETVVVNGKVRTRMGDVLAFLESVPLARPWAPRVRSISALCACSRDTHDHGSWPRLDVLRLHPEYEDYMKTAGDEKLRVMFHATADPRIIHHMDDASRLDVSDLSGAVSALSSEEILRLNPLVVQWFNVMPQVGGILQERFGTDKAAWGFFGENVAGWDGSLEELIETTVAATL